MNYGVYSLYDRVSKVYGHPSYFVNDEVCVRSIRIAASQPENQLRNTLPDLEVIKLGFFNDETGEMSMFDKQELVIKGSSFFEVNDGKK